MESVYDERISLAERYLGQGKCYFNILFGLAFFNLSILCYRRNLRNSYMALLILPTSYLLANILANNLAPNKFREIAQIEDDKQSSRQYYEALVSKEKNKQI